MRHDVVVFRVGEADVSLGRWNDATGRDMPDKAKQCVRAIRSPNRATFNTRVLTCPRPAQSALTTLWVTDGVRDFDQLNATVATGTHAGETWQLWEHRTLAQRQARKPLRQLTCLPRAGTKRATWDWTLVRRGKTDATGTVDVSKIAAPKRGRVANKRARAAAKLVP